MEDADDPENPLHLAVGDVILVDEGTVHKFSTPSKARGELFSNSDFSDSKPICETLRVWCCLPSGTFNPEGLQDAVRYDGTSLIALGVLPTMRLLMLHFSPVSFSQFPTLCIVPKVQQKRICPTLNGMSWLAS